MSRLLNVASAMLNVGLAALLYKVAVDPGPPGHELRAGGTAVSIAGFTVDERPGHLQFPQHGATIIYFFSPQCGWCERNLDSVSRLSRRTSGTYDFLAISIDEAGIADWLSLRHPTFPVWRRIDYRSSIAYPIQTTPTTLVVSKEGRIEKIWRGAYRDRTLSDIERFFGVVLPAAEP